MNGQEHCYYLLMYYLLLYVPLFTVNILLTSQPVNNIYILTSEDMTSFTAFSIESI